jgi:phenylacetate-CoA ligase
MKRTGKSKGDMPEMSIVNLLHAVLVIKTVESFTPQQVQDLQQRRFRKLLRYVFRKSRFYKGYYQEHRIMEGDIEKVEMQDLPVIDKRIVMDNYDELVCDPALKKDELERYIVESPDAGSKYKGVYRVIHTSGSSGTPAVFVYGPREWAAAKALGFRALAEKVNPFKRGKLAYIGATGGHFASTTTISDIPRILLDVLTVSINNPIEQICRDVDHFQPDALIGYASGLDLLAQQQIAGRLKIAPVRIWSSADPLTATMRMNVEKAFGVTPINIYTASEIMTFAAECKQRHRLHYFNDWFGVQLVDNDIEPVKTGLPGSLVVTNLYNYAQPLIRYQMDDEIILSSKPCPCGWPFPVIEKIAGRNEEILWFAKADGTKEFISPYVLEEFLIPGLEKFQFVQPAADRLTMKAVIHGKRNSIVPAIQKRMTEILSQKKLYNVVRLDIEFVDDIRNDPKTGKFRLIIPYSNNL